MTNVNTEQKLNILADSSKYDLSCACKSKDEPGRTRGPQGRWIYPATLPTGRKVFLLKTLQSNACVNDCSYCPFNQYRDIPRCTLGPDQLANIFMQLRQANRVEGLFLSSGVCSNADTTMARMLATVELLRFRRQFRGFIHLKIIPGASDEAVRQAVRLATRVSVNIETPSAQRLVRLSKRKKFHRDIIATMAKISHISRELGRKCHQTTQFVVGAAGESDKEIVMATDRLYSKFDMERIYFSAFQDTNSTDTHVKKPTKIAQPTLFDDIHDDSQASGKDMFMREHRLYQVDFLLRKYKFSRHDFYFDSNDNLSLERDPKLIWADHHPEFFPVDVNRADRLELLRIPGIGPIAASRIIKARRQQKISCINDLKEIGVRSRVARPYLKISGNR